jgi:hypothetical protein
MTSLRIPLEVLPEQLAAAVAGLREPAILESGPG